MKEYKLLKDYQIRHDVTVKKGSTIVISEYRGLQLAKSGIVEGDFDAKKLEENHKKSAQRNKKEETPTVVEHKIVD